MPADYASTIRQSRWNLRRLGVDLMTFILQVVLFAFMVCLLIRAVFSFIEPYPKNQVHRITFQVTEPVIAPVRRLVPPIGGFDIAFLLVFIAVSMVLQLIGRV
jgi:YggT family protein